MYSSEFDERIAIITNYFRSEYKWKLDEYGDYKYYKGKRNLKELEFMVDLVLGETLEVIKKEYVSNNDGNVNGGEIIGKCFIDSNFNGLRQGTGSADVYIQFVLFENGFYTDRSDRLETLLYLGIK